MAEAAHDVRGTGALHGVCRARAGHVPGHVHDVCMTCAWRVHGVCMARAWDVHGMCVAPAHGVRGELPMQHDVRRDRTQEALVK